MRFRPARISLLLSLLPAIACLLISAAPALAGDDWKPIDPAHLAMTAPVVEKDADAEGIFWEVRVQDDATGDFRTILNHYIRIKIFTERGKESEGKVDIEYAGQTKIMDVAARTIKPDGTIIELKKDAIFERTIAKAGGLKLKAKSFALPAVEPGVIIEYRWREVRDNHISFYDRYQLQRNIPIQVVKYYIKPAQFYTSRSIGMSMRMFHADPTPVVKEKDGFSSVTLTNMPAFREEPRMPPRDEMRAWMLIYYTIDQRLPPEKFWPKYGREIYEEYKPLMKANDDIKKAAAAAIADATTPEQKLQRLFEFCRTKIKNIYDDASGLTQADRAKLKANGSPADTLKRGMGTTRDIDLLFGALATAAGFEARLAKLSDRGDLFFDMGNADGYFMDTYNIAVKVNDQWRFFDPGSAYVPFDMLRWQEEGIPALISDPKEPTFVKTPLSPPEKSLQKRTATLSLSEDGTLEGDVRMEYTGQFAVERKEQNDEDSQQEREQNLCDQIKQKMSTAELSNINIENVTDPVKPFVYSFHVRVPGYAQRTGKRLFVQPAFFQRGVGALFSANERRMPVYFPYPWMEDDTVTIKLPSGYKLDNAESPGPFKAESVARYDVNIHVAHGQGDELVYKRTFTFNGLLFPKESYSGLKRVFDVLHERDNHTITLKQAATTP